MIVWSKKTRGFTLLEIMLAIGILSILGVTGFLAIPTYIDRANDARRKTDLHKLKTLLEVYYSMADGYPTSLPDCNQPFKYNTQVIMEKTPCDPITGEPYYYQVRHDSPQTYRLYAKLVNEQDISIVDVGCQGGCGPDCYYNYGVSSTNTNLKRCSYVCAPGGGQEGSCELYEDTESSICPKLYFSDQTCNNECSDREFRCENASGKNVPD